jgi:adenylate kinase
MAPITDSAVSDLKALVNKLESRIADLESKLDGGKSSLGGDAGSMRMILMGPPGAGMLMATFACLVHCGC